MLFVLNIWKADLLCCLRSRIYLLNFNHILMAGGKKMMTKIRISALIMLLCSTIWTSAWEPDKVPDPRARDGSHLADPHQYLSREEAQVLNADLQRLETDTGAQFAVVVLDELAPGLDVHDFGVELFETWGLGQKGRNNGLLLLIVMNTHDWRFNTGYGLEPILTDALLSKLGHSCIVPNFKEEQYARGLNQVVEKIHTILSSENPQEEAQFMAQEESWWTTWIIFMWIFWGLPFLIGLHYLQKPSPESEPQAPKTHSVTIHGERAGIRPLSDFKIPSWGGDKTTRFITLHVLSLMIPLLAMFQGRFLSNPVFNSILAFLCWLILTLVTVQYKKSHYISKRAGNRIDRFFLLNKVNQRLGLKAFFFPFPFLFIYVFHRIRMSRLKKSPFPCPICQSEAHPADQTMLEEVLGPAKLLEKQIRSIDHRVYQCPRGHHTEIPFPGRRQNSYTPCSSCGTLAMHQTGSQTLTDSTYDSTGTGQKEFTCRYCQAVRFETYIIPVKTRSTSSSGSGGGSSGGSSSGGGSSWGGGSTGGGGAGGKW